MLGRVIETGMEQLGSDHPLIIDAKFKLAFTFEAMGDLLGAEALYEEAYEANCAKWGDAHPDTIAVVNEWARMLADGDRLGNIRIERTSARTIMAPEHLAGGWVMGGDVVFVLAQDLLPVAERGRDWRGVADLPISGFPDEVAGVFVKRRERDAGSSRGPARRNDEQVADD